MTIKIPLSITFSEPKDFKTWPINQQKAFKESIRKTIFMAIRDGIQGSNVFNSHIDKVEIN